MSFTVPALTQPQQDAITFWQAYNVPGTWFVSQPGNDGRVEVLRLHHGDDGLSMWSIVVEPDGETYTSEYGPDDEGDPVWSTGIEV